MLNRFWLRRVVWVLALSVRPLTSQTPTRTADTSGVIAIRAGRLHRRPRRHTGAECGGPRARGKGSRPSGEPRHPRGEPGLSTCRKPLFSPGSSTATPTSPWRPGTAAINSAAPSWMRPSSRRRTRKRRSRPASPPFATSVRRIRRRRLRNAINRGDIPGPRIQAATMAISATGGHGDVNGLSPSST